LRAIFQRGESWVQFRPKKNGCVEELTLSAMKIYKNPIRKKGSPAGKGLSQREDGNPNGRTQSDGNKEKSLPYIGILKKQRR